MRLNADRARTLIQVAFQDFFSRYISVDYSAALPQLLDRLYDHGFRLSSANS